MKRILITGFSGFIGSHLTERLLRDGNEVIGIDNYFTGSKQNISHLLSNPNLEIIRHDVTIPYTIQCDEIYNLACPASPVAYQRFPVQTINTSVQGMINALKLATKIKAKVLQASTSEVYGDPKISPQLEEYWGNVNPIGIRSCFSDDTEISTENGWKLFKNLSIEDKVGTLVNGKLKYVCPQNIIIDPYIGELIEFKNHHCDLWVTPNHKMYVQKRNDKNPKFQLLSAFESINWNRAKMLKIADYIGIEQEWFYFPKDIDVRNSKSPIIEKIKMDDWLEFFGYYITEGCVYIQNRKKKVNGKEYDNKEYRILIAQSEEKNKSNFQKIEDCLKKLPFDYTIIDHQFQIGNKQLANYLIQFGKSHEKFIDRLLMNLSKRQLIILFNSMMLGDGNKKGTTYYSNSYKLISDFQEILIKIGFAGNIALHDKRKDKPVYQIHILNRFNQRFITPTYSKRKVVKYNGTVYCVTVPSGIILVRRNGKALFCGNCYDEGKRCAETICMDYHRQFGTKVKIARIFNTYGPHMASDDGRVVSNFITQALQGQDLTIYGDGKQTRSFQYVDDCIDGLIKLMNTEDDYTGPVNIGNPQEFTIMELAEKVIKMTGTKSKVIYKDLPADDPLQRKPDITKAILDLHWQPYVELHEGLTLTINYFKKL